MFFGMDVLPAALDAITQARHAASAIRDVRCIVTTSALPILLRRATLIIFLRPAVALDWSRLPAEKTEKSVEPG